MRPGRPDGSAIWGARGTRSSAIFDVDGDGDLDIVTNEFNTAPMVLVSNLTEKTRVHYLEVKLIGTDVESRRAGRHRQGHGRRVDLHQGHGRQLRVSVAQPVAAVLRPRCGRSGRRRRRRCGRQGRSRPFDRRSRSIRWSTCASSKSPVTALPRRRIVPRQQAHWRAATPGAAPGTRPAPPSPCRLPSAPRP